MTYDNLRFCFIFLVLHHAGHWIVHSTTSDDDLDGQQHISTSEWTYDQVYWKGKEAYSENRWSECVALFTRAIQLHKRHRRDEAACRLKCHLQADNTELLIPEGPYVFFERAIWDTLCLTTCQKHPVATNRDVAATNRVIDQEFENLVPYDYLQMCYFKVNDLQNAASATYTFLLKNPNHEVMIKNFQFYVTQPEIDINTIRNLEAQSYQELFLKGNDAYNRRDYEETVDAIEEALQRYLEAEEECRLLCEGHFEHAPALDLTMSIANHFTFSLRCKQRCPTTLATFYGQEHHDFLPSHYHYLQFAYYKIGDIRKACEAIGTFLLFHPDNETMLHNKEYFTVSRKEVNDVFFTPRKEVVQYVQRDTQEKLLLQLIVEKFDKKKETASFTATSSGSKQKHADDQLPPVSMAEDNRIVDKGNLMMMMRERELNGTDRFAVDGFLSTDGCQTLMDLADEAAVHGDGYNGRSTPHTKFETFEGLTVGRAAVLVKLGYLTKERVKLFLDVSERSRKYVEKYFKLKEGQLYFSYTHLVCRTATPDSPMNRSDLSHPVHADNCVLTKDGRCIKDKPAFTWRDYSSILYLNDDFNGGDFLFMANKDTIQASVRPKCGRMIGFSAGQENLHGVQAVLKGRRCALAMWFTLDHKHRERERFLALQVLDQLDVEGMTKTTNQQDDNVKYKNYNEEITISKNDELEDPSDSQDFEIPRSEWSEMNTFQLTTSHGFSDSTYDREEL